MSDFIANWWYILLFLSLYLLTVIFVGVMTEEDSYKGGSRLKGYLILAGILVPIPFLISSYKSEIGAYLISLYYSYLGAVFIGSYFKPKYCFMFTGFATVTKYLVFPRFKEILLIPGGLMFVASSQKIFEIWTSAN
ncbi:MAG: hypothetical protein AB2805_08330 [Candidatus Thiodiazotropha sp.]